MANIIEKWFRVPTRAQVDEYVSKLAPATQSFYKLMKDTLDLVSHDTLEDDFQIVAQVEAIFAKFTSRSLEAKAECDRMVEEQKRRESIPPADRSQRVLVSGNPVPEDNSHMELKPNGQQKDYVVLSPEERSKGFVRPVRHVYIHVGCLPEDKQRHYPITRLDIYGEACGHRTVMGKELAETYARDPKFYTGTFCVSCGKHFPLDEFVWEGTTEQVGS